MTELKCPCCPEGEHSVLPIAPSTLSSDRADAIALLRRQARSAFRMSAHYFFLTLTSVANGSFDSRDYLAEAYADEALRLARALGALEGGA